MAAEAPQPMIHQIRTERFGVSEAAQRRMAARIRELAAQGWKETNRVTERGKYKGGCGCLLALIFLPLALLAGHDQDSVIVTFERDVSESVVREQAKLAAARQSKTLSWVFGLLFAFGCLAAFPSNVIAGFGLLVPAIVLLPPTMKIIDGRLKKPLTVGIKSVIIIVSLIVWLFATVAGTTSTPSSTIPVTPPLSAEEQARLQAARVQDEARARAVQEERASAALKTKLRTDSSAVGTFKAEVATLGNDVPAGIHDVLSKFEGWSNDVKSGKASKDPEIVKLASDLEKQLSKVQVAMFPIMRGAFGKEASKALWIADGKAEVSGSGNRTVTFVSASYVTHANIADSQKSIGETLYDLRFTQVRYKWYEDASEYSYFNITVPKDSEIVPWLTKFSGGVFGQ